MTPKFDTLANQYLEEQLTDAQKKKLLALIVRGKYIKKKGVTFFTPNESTQQFGYMKHKKKHIIKPHLHKKRITKILYTTEVILLLKGVLRVDFYNYTKKYLFSKILKQRDIIMLVHGGHGFSNTHCDPP